MHACRSTLEDPTTLHPDIALPEELKTVPRTMLVPLGALVAALAALNLFASIRLWQGRRIGFLLCALLAIPAIAYPLYDRLVAHPTPFDTAAIGNLAWSSIVPLYCLLRLIGWGPKPN